MPKKKRGKRRHVQRHNVLLFGNIWAQEVFNKEIGENFGFKPKVEVIQEVGIELLDKVVNNSYKPEAVVLFADLNYMWKLENIGNYNLMTPNMTFNLDTFINEVKMFYTNLYKKLPLVKFILFLSPIMNIHLYNFSKIGSTLDPLSKRIAEYDDLIRCNSTLNIKNMADFTRSIFLQLRTLNAKMECQNFYLMNGQDILYKMSDILHNECAKFLSDKTNNPDLSKCFHNGFFPNSEFIREFWWLLNKIFFKHLDRPISLPYDIEMIEPGCSTSYGNRSYLPSTSISQPSLKRNLYNSDHHIDEDRENYRKSNPTLMQGLETLHFSASSHDPSTFESKRKIIFQTTTEAIKDLIIWNTVENIGLTYSELMALVRQDIYRYSVVPPK